MHRRVVLPVRPPGPRLASHTAAVLGFVGGALMPSFALTAQGGRGAPPAHDLLWLLAAAACAVFFAAQTSIPSSPTTDRPSSPALEKLLQLVQAAPDVIATLDRSARVEWVNPTARDLLGPVLGASLGQRMPPWSAAVLEGQALPGALRAGVWSGALALLSGDAEVPLTATIAAHGPSGFSLIARRSPPAEEWLRESRGRLQLINSVATQVGAGTEPQQVARRAVEQLSAFFPAFRVRYCTITKGGAMNVDYAVEPRRHAGGPMLPPLQGFACDLSAAPEYLALVRGPGAVPVTDAPADRRFAGLEAFLAASGIRATLSHALAPDGGVQGLIALDAASPREWTEHEIGTLSEVCDYLTLAISGSRTVQDRLHAEERLRHSEERLRLIIENMPALAFALNSLGRIVFWNKEAQRVTGYPAAEIVGDPSGLERLLPDPAYRKFVTSSWAPGKGERGRPLSEVRDFEFTVVGKDGSPHVISWSSISHRFPVPGWEIWGIATDVTQRRRAEESLRQSEERYRLLFESSPQPMWVYDSTDLRFLAVNEAAVREYGYSREEFESMRITDIRPSEDLGRLLEATRPARQGLVTGSGPWRHRKKDGTLIDVEISGHSVPFIASDARLVIVSDVTDRNRYLAQLNESRALLEQAQAVGHVGSWVSGTQADDGLLWSRETCRIFGLPHDKPHHATTVSDFFSRVHPADRETVRAAANAALEGGDSYNIDHRITRPDGSVRWVHEQAVIERDDSGRPLRMVGVVQDITERKLAEEQMARHTQELARSNAELERFAYVASHDLQEPLRMVTSFTQLLAQRYEDKLDKDAHEFIGFAVEGATRMQRLIEDLLAYSRVGSANRKPQRIRADAALRRATANLYAAINDSQAQIDAGPLPEVVADESQLSMVFQNLIGNAIKFRGAGPPRIAVTAQRRDGQWLLSVRDNGIGIDERHRERLFTMFHRLHPRSVYPGNGIGLAICKRIVEGHGGRIWVESSPGQGSTFFFTLPEESAQ